jgi:cbb3-type cytochrome oxidase subunit 3
MSLTDMELINILRVLVTVAAFTAFIGIVFWALNGKRRELFTAAARMPLDEDDGHLGAGSPPSLRSERSGQ